MKPYYQDGAVTIYQGEASDILPKLEHADLVLTDPPYGIGFAAQPTKYQRFAGMKPSEWDNAPPNKQLMNAVLNAGNDVIIWGGNYFELPVSRGWLGWIKRDAPPSMGTLELAWTSRDQNTKYFDQTISATNAERVGHPTQKPLALFTWCLSLFPDAQTIIDPFAGSGTTGRAAKDMGRQAVLIEREEKYCEIAARRMSQSVLQFA